MSSSSDYLLPLPVRRGLRKLGSDLRDARLRRRIPAAVVAERASISRKTLFRLEQGDPAVSVGIAGKVLFVLGFSERLAELADIRNDTNGLALLDEQLPKRIRTKKRRPIQQDGSP